ncbi:hypothetical protein A9P82_07135 [Arachidicoccus ginsenosidimutans]|uniref:hypothetical protein n=1 Tax=Arachidicoccus sp. BS20 TaxID=1850526 RepID=UPI0007F066F3|nr:hypothetical protein [Arachidicoccus sp. BS20]ANI89083.1 hypothetical protein A9P82_07135 [Arachidicoccus sp. BS20]
MSSTNNGNEGGASNVVSPVPPSVIIDSVYNITSTGAYIAGHVSGKGSSNVVARGVIFSKDSLFSQPDSVEASSAYGDGRFICQLTGLDFEETYYVKVYATNFETTGVSSRLSFTALTLQNATYNKKPIFIVGNTTASLDIQIVADRGIDISERGMVYGTSSDISSMTHKVTDKSGIGIGTFRLTLNDLTPATWYYVRPYTVDKAGINYGYVDSFKTIRPSDIQVVYNKPDNPTGDEATFWKQIKIAADSAAWYLSHYTSATKTYTINYSPGTPTADDNNEGWIRVGTSSSYWTIATMEHEMNHGIGNGTTSWWTTMIQNGIYTGKNGQEMIRLITGDSTAVLNGDSQHFWPYGLNQNSEVTSSWDYVYSALIVESFRKDGLSNAGTYEAP